MCIDKGEKYLKNVVKKYLFLLITGSITETELSAALLAKIDEKANKSEVIPLSEKGSPGGVATLDENGRLHPDQLPEAASPDAAQFLAAHPVLSIYMTTAPDESTPAQMAAKHGGTWTVWGAGRTPVGVGTSDRAFAIGEKQGASTHTLTAAQSGVPAHTHIHKKVIAIILKPHKTPSLSEVFL